MNSNTDHLEVHIGHVVQVEITNKMIAAIRTAQKLRKSGHTKIAAVRAVYPLIKDHHKHCIWYSIMKGVEISSRGAVTYYYNVRERRG